MRAPLALTLAALGALGCGQPIRPNGVTDADAILTIHTNVADAGLWVDGRFVAPMQALHGGVALEPGHHRLELRRDDYFSNYLEVDAKIAERRVIDLQLSPILP